MNDHCCEIWEKATKENTDSEGNGPFLIWFGDEEIFDFDMLPRMGNIVHDTELPPLEFCPWCGKGK